MMKIEHLSVQFNDEKSSYPAVQDFHLQMDQGEIVGIVGESGSGKSMTAHAIMGLVPRSAARVTGKVEFEGTDLLSLSYAELRKYQGKEISIIFQEPMKSLNPSMRIGKQVEEALYIHTDLSGAERKKLALNAMELAGLTNAEQLYRCYPHELSGGMRQRVMIASAIILRPKLLIADEPTTALDVTIQMQILETLKKINETENTAILFISHDLRIINALCPRVIVMQHGQIVEEGMTEQAFRHPNQDYTKMLIASRPTRKKLAGRNQNVG